MLNIHDLVDKEITGKFKTNNPTDKQIKKYKIHGSKLIDGKKFMYAHVIIPVIMHCAKPESFKFKRNLGFKLHNVINCKEQTVLESMLCYRIDLYFHEYKLAIEVDELGHNDRNIDYEIQRQRATEKELGPVFVKINPDEEIFKIFRVINKIQTY